MVRVRISTERSDVTELVSAAIKTSFNTRSLEGVERCVDVLNQLKSLSLSVKDILLSLSISKLDNLRSHRNPKIRKEAKDLFDSWSETLYAEGRDNSYKASLKGFGQKPKNLVLKGSLGLQKKEEDRSLTCEMKKETDFVVLMKNEEQRSLIRETDKIKKNTRIESLESTLAREAVEIKPLNLKRRGDALEAVATKKRRVEVKDVVSANQKVCSRQNMEDRDGKVTTKTLIPPPRRDETVKDSVNRNPKSAALKSKTEEFVDLFEKAKKAADAANAKGIILGKAESSRCVDALTLLLRINVTPKPREPKNMMEKLERLTKHKDRKICHAASSLLQLWRQKIRDQQRRDSSTKLTKKQVM